MRIGGYLRLSRDEDKESYSSILTQKSIIEEFAESKGWEITRFYEDDNCSGYSFDRMGFNEMLKDLEMDRLDVVIAKDLSRIGRHNANTLLFIERIRNMKKRLILPKEGNGYDSDEDENDLLGITTWYNEMYVKDISRKTKSSIKAKQREGSMIIRECFGYIKTAYDKHQLEIDHEAASIVRYIFQLYSSGIGYRKIADKLNEEGFLTPSQYIRRKSIMKGQLYNGKVSEHWNAVHIQRIIKNDIYVGTLRLSKTEKKLIKGKSQKKPAEEHFVFYNHHPAIISSEVFEEAQKSTERRNVTHSKGAASIGNLYSGLLFCKDCGSYMIAYNKKGKERSYICGGYHKLGKKACSRHTIREALLDAALRNYLNVMLVKHINELASIELHTISTTSKNDDELLAKYLQEKQSLKEQHKLIMKQKLVEDQSTCSNKAIRQQSLEELENETVERLLYLDEIIQNIKDNRAQDKTKPIANAAEALTFILKTQLCKNMMEILVDKILIDREGSPTIYLRGNFDAICYHSGEDVN